MPSHGINKLKRRRSESEESVNANESGLECMTKQAQPTVMRMTLSGTGASVALSNVSLWPNSPTTSKSKLHFNSLPYVVLRIIFSKLSIRDVLQVRRVCGKWKTYQEEILAKVHSITLLVGEPDSNIIHYQYHYHSGPHLEKLVNDDGTFMYQKRRFNAKSVRFSYSFLCIDTVQCLNTTLSNIVNLQIKINQVSCVVLDQVLELVQKCSSRLTTFKLWCQFSELSGKQLTIKMVQLLSAVNSLPLLKHLTVELKHELYPRTFDDADRAVDGQLLEAVPHFDMPILAQLREFFFSSSDMIKRTKLLDSLKRFVPSNSRLTRIGLGSPASRSTYKQLANQFPNVASQITSIPMVVWVCIWESEQKQLAVRPILAKFSSLTEVSIFVNDSLMFSQLANSFTSLIHLVRLHLYLSLPKEDPNFVPLFLDNNTPLSQVGQLPSVKMLSFKVDADEPLDLNSPFWVWTFPNVQVVEFRCLSMDSTLADVQQMVQTFLQCPKLKHIYTYEEETEWTEWNVVSADVRKSFLLVL